MTFGEKLKKARADAGLSQEQLALKICVSRSAVAKWETDKGIPDIENLKAIAKLLNVSVDCLLDDDTEIDFSVMREPVNISDYGKGRRKVVKDRIVREKYPDAEIFTLLAKEKFTKAERVADIIFFLFSNILNIMEIVKGFNNLDKEYYLVNQGEQQYLVLVSNEFIESRRLVRHFTERKFEIGNYKFIKCDFKVR